jgi:taurine--2-oxoglutarate transaminase
MDVYADGLIQNVRDLGPVLADHLGRLEASHDVVGHTRGRGFLRAVEFTDPETGEPFFDPRADSGDDNPVSAVLDETRDRRVLFGAGRPTFQVMIAPPLVATEEDIAAAVDVLDEAIEAVF